MIILLIALLNLIMNLNQSNILNIDLKINPNPKEVKMPVSPKLTKRLKKGRLASCSMLTGNGDKIFEKTKTEYISKLVTSSVTTTPNYFNKKCVKCKQIIPEESEGYEKHLHSCSRGDIKGDNQLYSILTCEKQKFISNEFDIAIDNNVKHDKKKMRKKSVDDIRNYDIKQIRNNVKNYFI